MDVREQAAADDFFLKLIVDTGDAERQRRSHFVPEAVCNLFANCPLQGTMDCDEDMRRLTQLRLLWVELGHY